MSIVSPARSRARRMLALATGLVAATAAVIAASPAAAAEPTPIPSGIYKTNTWGQPGSVLWMLFAGDAPCADSGTRDWDFIDGSGTHPLSTGGFGEDALGIYWGVYLADANTDTPLSLGGASKVDGQLRLTCTPSGGGAVQVVTIPLTIAASEPASTYHTSAQWTWHTPGAVTTGSLVTVNALGFAPGENTTVTLVNYDAWDRNGYTSLDGVVATPVAAVADGEGAVTAQVSAPAGWLSGDEIAPAVAGATSHYALSATESSPLVGDPSLTLTSGASAFRGGAVSVVASGFNPGESVVVALHSASAPALPLATLTANGSGQISGNVRVPVTAPLGAHRLWTGSKSSGYTLLNTPLDVTEAPDVTRLAGATRYDVGVMVSQQAYPVHADVVFVATGANYPDALSAGPLAARSGAPLLLTPGDQLLPSIADEIERLDPDTIYVVGGPNSVRPAVFDALAALQPNTIRLSGADRFEASRGLVEAGWGDSGAPLIYISTGLNFPDALSAGAAAGAIDAPVLLVPGTSPTLDAATLELLDDLAVVDVKIAGGPNSVSPGIEAQLKTLLGNSHVVRLAGADRFVASEAISRDVFGAEGASRVFVATGLNFPDALTGSAWAGAVGGPLFVVPGTCVPSRVQEDISAFGAEQVTLLGGVNSLSPAVVNFAAC